MMTLRVACGSITLVALATAANFCAAADDEPVQRLYSGRVVFLAEALKERGIDTSEETGKHVVLVTDDGEILPILANWRGRAFYQDEKLRNRRVDLIGFQHHGLAYLNVISVYTFDEEGQRMFTDYWCDVCSIPMYEIKPCDCCQGPIRLRFQPKELPDYIRSPEAPASPKDE